MQFGHTDTTIRSTEGIPIYIDVPTSYNGQTLDIYYKSPGGSWSVLDTCTVSSGACYVKPSRFSSFAVTIDTEDDNGDQESTSDNGNGLPPTEPFEDESVDPEADLEGEVDEETDTEDVTTDTDEETDQTEQNQENTTTESGYQPPYTGGTGNQTITPGGNNPIIIENESGDIQIIYPEDPEYDDVIESGEYEVVGITEGSKEICGKWCWIIIGFVSATAHIWIIVYVVRLRKREESSIDNSVSID